MSERDILQELFHPSSLIPLTDKYGKYSVLLREHDCEDSYVTIRNVPYDLLAIDIDQNFDNQHLFAPGSHRGFCKRSDYLLLSEAKQCAIFLEMKRARAPEKDIRLQLIGGLCVFRYCSCVVQNFFNEEFLLGYQCRFVSLRHTALAKKPTGKQITQMNDAPEKMMKVAHSKSVEFNHIAKLST